MKSAKCLENSGETILGVSGRGANVMVTMIGSPDQIKAILKTAVDGSPALKEILEGLFDRSAAEPSGKKR